MNGYITVGELKKFIEPLDDDTPIVTYRSNMEGSGYTDRYIRVKAQKMFKYEEERHDAFDGTPYTESVLYSYPMDHLEKKEEKICLIIE